MSHSTLAFEYVKVWGQPFPFHGAGGWPVASSRPFKCTWAAWLGVKGWCSFSQNLVVLAGAKIRQIWRSFLQGLVVLAGAKLRQIRR